MVFIRIVLGIGLIVAGILISQSCHAEREAVCNAKGGAYHCDYAYKSSVCGCYTPDGRRIFDDDR